MAQMGEIQHRGEPSDVKGVMNYVYQLEEQVRYVLANLGSDNLAPGSVDLAQLGPNVTKKFTTIVQETEGLFGKSRATDKKIITLAETTDGLTLRVSDAEGNISSINDTAEAIGLSVLGIDLTNANEGVKIKGSQFEISKEGVSINSTGALTINTTNLKLDADGNAEFGGELKSPSGYIGGFYIGQGELSSENYVTTLSTYAENAAVGDVFAMYKQNYDGSRDNKLIFSVAAPSGITYIRQLYMYKNSNWVDVTSAILALI